MTPTSAFSLFFFFNDTATTEIYTLSLHDALPIFYGAATMLRESGEHPVILREAVTSPGGTTISAIRELEKHGVRAAFLAAIEAARDRGRELGGGLSSSGEISRQARLVCWGGWRWP